MADNPSCPKCGHYNAVINGVCRDCAHIVDEEELASGPMRASLVPVDDSDDGDETVIDPLAYRGRGAPRKPPDQKRREKLMISLTESEMNAIVLVSAEQGYRKVQDFVRNVLNRTVEYYHKKKAEEGK